MAELDFTREETLAKATKLIDGNPTLKDQMQEQWDGVWKVIGKYRAESKKLHKNYEMQINKEEARYAMLEAFVDGKTPRECRRIALAKIGLVEKQEDIF